jgi:hypothetical protein
MRGQIVVDPLPEVTGVAFTPASVRAGGTYTTVFSGANLNNQTYFDVRFRSPGSAADQEVQNWQRGASASHTVPATTPVGTWTITGVRPHQEEADHAGNYMAVSGTLSVTAQ